MLATYSKRRSAQPTPNTSKLALADQPATNASRRRDRGSLGMVFAVAGRARRRWVGGCAVAVTYGRPNDERGQQKHRDEHRQPYSGCPPGAEPSLQPQQQRDGGDQPEQTEKSGPGCAGDQSRAG
jgi:hypothetical protein